MSFLGGSFIFGYRSNNLPVPGSPTGKTYQCSLWTIGIWLDKWSLFGKQEIDDILYGGVSFPYEKQSKVRLFHGAPELFYWHCRCNRKYLIKGSLEEKVPSRGKLPQIKIFADQSWQDVARVEFEKNHGKKSKSKGLHRKVVQVHTSTHQTPQCHTTVHCNTLHCNTAWHKGPHAASSYSYTNDYIIWFSFETSTPQLHWALLVSLAKGKTLWFRGLRFQP